MQLEVGTIIEGKVLRITNFGAFVDVGNKKFGMVHISEISNSYVKEVQDCLKIGQIVKAKIVKINDKGEIALSMKALEPKKTEQKFNHNKLDKFNNSQKTFNRKSTMKSSVNNFENLMSKFKRLSEDKMSDLRRTTESKRGSCSRRSSQR